MLVILTGLHGAVAKSSANVLVGTGFTSRYRLQPKASNRVTTNNSPTVLDSIMLVILTGLHGAVAKSLANVLVGTGFTSRYRLQPKSSNRVNSPTVLDSIMLVILTDLHGAVAKSSANVLVGTGFTSRYRLQPTEAKWVAVRPLLPLVSH